MSNSILDHKKTVSIEVANIGIAEWFSWFWLRSAGFPVSGLEEIAFQPNLIARLKNAPEDMRAVVFVEAMASTRKNLVTKLSTPLAREALYLSNPEALKRIDQLAQGSLDIVNRRTRERVRLGWRYLQRFCAKNDTTSFFGPIAWGHFTTQTKAITSMHEEGSITKQRCVALEYWVTEAIANAIVSDVSIQSDIPVRLNPACTIRDGALYIPTVVTPLLPAPVIQAMSIVEAATTDGILWQEACNATGDNLENAISWLSDLLNSEILLPAIIPAPGVIEPITLLEDAISRTGSSKWLTFIKSIKGYLSEFESGCLNTRQKIDVQVRKHLTDAGIATTRSTGSMYVGRFPFYEDCSRNMTMSLGPSFATRLTLGLAPVLLIHRTVSEIAALRLNRRQIEHFRSLGGDESKSVPLIAMLRNQKDENWDGISREITEKLKLAWNSALAERVKHREIELTVEDAQAICALLKPSIDMSHCLGVDIVSPDILIERGDENLQNGEDWRLVLGEIHPAVLTAVQPVAMPFCPDVDSVTEEVTTWLERPRLQLADSAKTYQRSHISWPQSARLTEIMLPNGHSRLRQSIPSSRCEVVLKDSVLFVRDIHSGAEDDLVTVCSSDLHRILFSTANAVSGGHLESRITSSSMIIKRRTWSIGRTLTFPLAPAESADDFLAIRQWAESKGMPRFVFVKSSSEPKPMFVDFNNPLAADMLARASKNDDSIVISEMRPAPDRLWLQSDGAHYCSELRLSVRLRALNADKSSQ
ncbi:MAG: lantibiotic dehydratase [Sedimenticola sp.]